MSGELYNKKIVAVGKMLARGLPVYQPQTNTPPYRDSCQVQLCSGNAAGFIVPDFTGSNGPVTLLEDLGIPSEMRVYVTRLDVDVQGSTPWSSTALDYVTLQDSVGCPVAYLPMNALRGASAYTFPDSDADWPFWLAGSTAMGGASYTPATGVLSSLGTSTLINNTLVGVPFTIMGGTGKYSTGVITANTATSVTLSPAPAAIDSTSVIAIWYWAASAGSSSSATFSNAAKSSPAWAQHALDNGFNLVSVFGASIGSSRPISDNAAPATGSVTAAYSYNTSPSAGDLFHITNEGNLMGCVDMGIAEKWPVLTPGKGLQVAVSSNGTVTAGSPLRVYVEAFVAY